MTNDAKADLQWNVDRFLKYIQETEAGPKDQYAKYEQMGRYLVLLLEHSLAAYPLTMRKQVQECFAIRERTLAAWREETTAFVARIEAQKEARSKSLATANEL